MKNLKKFATVAEYNTFKNSLTDLDYPVTSYIEATHEIKFDNDYSKQYFTVEMLASGALRLYNNDGSTCSIGYSINGGGWVTISIARYSYADTTMNAGDKMRIRSTSTNMKRIYSTAKHKVYGNIRSMVNGDNFKTGTATYFSYYFSNDTGLVDASNLVLPSSGGNFNSLFAGCTSLEEPPREIAVNNLSRLYDTFYNCSKLNRAPKIMCSDWVGSSISRIYNYAPKNNRLDFGPIDTFRSMYDMQAKMNNFPTSVKYFICDKWNDSRFASDTEFNAGQLTNFATMSAIKGASDRQLWFEDYRDYDTIGWAMDDAGGITTDKGYTYTGEVIEYNGKTYYLWVNNEGDCVYNIPYAHFAYALTETLDYEYFNSVRDDNVQEIEECYESYCHGVQREPDYPDLDIIFLGLDMEAYTGLDEVLVRVQ